MLDALRQGAGKWIGTVFIALLALSFGIWGIQDVFLGTNTRAIATVGNTDISSIRFERTYLAQMRQLGRRFNRAITPREAVALGLPGQILGIMVNEATLNDAAKGMNLGVSDDLVTKSIAKDERFRDPSGNFDRNYFRQILNQNNMTEDLFVIEQRNTVLRQQVAAGLIGGIGVPNTYLNVVNIYRNEEREIKYITLAPSVAGDIAEPTESELDTFFQARKAEFKAPEYRKLAILKVEPEDIIKPEDVSDADVRKEFDSSTKYVTAEKRDVQQIVFPSREEADAARKKITEGKTFTDIATERGLKEKDYTLGLVAKKDILDGKVGEAAFTLAEGTVSEVIEGRFGSVLARVVTIQPEVRKPFEEVADQLRKDLATVRAESEILEMHDAVEDARAGGATLTEIAERFKLKLTIVEAVDANGKDKSDADIGALPAKSAIISAAFKSDVGIENDPIAIGQRGFSWFDVTEVTPSRDRALTEIRDKAVAAWKKDQLENALGAKATEAAKRLKDGTPIETVALDLGVAVTKSGKLKRQGQDDGLSASTITAAFAGPQGYVGTTQASGNDRIVFVVTDVAQPAFFAQAEGLQEAGKQMATQLGETVLAQYITKMQTDLGITINQPLLERIVNPSTTSNYN